MGKHTQGKWDRGTTLWTNETKDWTRERVQLNERLERGLIYAFFTPIDEGCGRVVIAEVRRDNPDYEANACLIEAAPDLLEALRDCSTWMSEHGCVPPCLQDAFRAIAKATGESQ